MIIEVYEILFIAGFLLLILGMIPIFCGFIKTIFEMIVDIKNHNYDMLPELLFLFMYFIVDDTVYRTTYFTVNDFTLQTFPVISMLIAAIMFCLININISQEIDKENNIISYELSIGTLFKAKLKK